MDTRRPSLLSNHSMGVWCDVADSLVAWPQAWGVVMLAIENIVLMALLMALGVGVVFALLAGFVYYLEVMDD